MCYYLARGQRLIDIFNKRTTYLTNEFQSENFIVDGKITVKSDSPNATISNMTVSKGTSVTFTHKFHFPSCSSVNQMKDKNKSYYTGTRDDVIAMGYDPCKHCNP